jgi:hypothetical protein
MSASWKARVNREDDDSAADDFTDGAARQRTRDATSSGDDANAQTTRWNFFRNSAIVSKIRDARGQRGVSRVKIHALEAKSDEQLGRLRERCARTLAQQETKMSGLPSVDIEGGDVGANKDVESIARALAVGDKERERAGDIIVAIDKILATRRKRNETKYIRRIGSIPNDATRLVNEHSLRWFIHRGIYVEGLDDGAFRRLFDRCLGGLGNESLTRERLIPVEHLVKLVLSGTWKRYWDEYANDAMRAALERGCTGPAVALYAIADTDPLGADEFEGIPDASTLLDGPASYLSVLFQLLTLPVTGPLLGFFSKSVRRTLHMIRFMFYSSKWRSRNVSSSFVALGLYYTPFWILGIIVIYFFFTADYNMSLISDGAVPAAIAFTLTSFVAMALASADVHTYSKMSAVTLFFPGGKSELPDGDSKLVQEHPTVDTLRSREIPTGMRASQDDAHVAKTETADADDRDGNTHTPPNGRGRKNGGKSGDVPRWLAEMDNFADNLENVQDAHFRKVKLGRKSQAHGTKDGVRGDFHAKFSIEDIVASNKLLQLKTVSERDVLDALLARTNEESWRSYWLSSRTTHWTQMLIFLIMSFGVAALPYIVRLGRGVSMFGEPTATSFCVDPARASLVPSFLGFEACPTSASAIFQFQSVAPSMWQGSSSGIILSFVWQMITMFVFLITSRWLCACAFHDMLHWLMFQATTDPSSAAAFDIPFVNICQSWLPWIRIRMVVEDFRELEQYWCTFYMSHVLTLIVGIVAVSLVKVLRLYLFFDLAKLTELGDSPPVYPLIVATLLMVPLLTMASSAAKVHDIQEADCVQLQEARWKLFLDNSTILNAGMAKEKAAILQRNELSIEALKSLEQIVERRNADAYPTVFGVRIGSSVLSALYALAFFCAGLTAAAIAIDVFMRYQAPMNATDATFRDLLRLGFASVSLPH